MAKKVSLLFYKSLIISDFLIIRKKYKVSKLFINFLLEIKIDNFIVCLNILETLKSLKQFISILLFLKGQKPLILFYVPNKQYRALLNEYFIDTLKLQDILFLQNLQFKLPEKYFSVDKKTQKRNYTTFFSCLGFDKAVSLPAVLQKQIFLLSTVNVKSSFWQFGDYKVFNDMLELQKIFFFVILAKQILKNKKNV
jgi:hypothetical protein